MKKILLIIICSVMVITAANSQTKQIAPNSSQTFQVTQTNSGTVSLDGTSPYTWTATGTGVVSTSPVVGSPNKLIVNTGAAGTSVTVTVFATSAATCKSDEKTATYSVENLNFAGSFDVASQDICPLNAQNPGGGDPASVGITFTSVDGTLVSSYVYSVDGGTPVLVTLASASLTASLDLAASTAFNASGAHTIEIVSITGGTKTSIQPTGAIVHTINNSAPAISDIF